MEKTGHERTLRHDILELDTISSMSYFMTYWIGVCSRSAIGPRVSWGLSFLGKHFQAPARKATCLIPMQFLLNGIPSSI